MKNIKTLLKDILDINKLYPAITRVFILVLLLYWFGGEWLPLLDFMIMLPWVFYVLPVCFVSMWYYLATKKSPGLGILVIVLWALPFLVSFNYIAPPLAAKAESQIRVCSLNTKYFFDFNLKSDALKAIIKQDCDVYLFQEVWEAKVLKAYIDPTISIYFPGFYKTYRGEFLTLSKYPISSEVLDEHDGFLKTIIDAPGGKMAVFNTHIWNPLGYRPCDSFELLDSTNQKPDCVFEPSVLRKLQHQNLDKVLSETTEPIVISGDFNSPQNMRIIQELSVRYTNVYTDLFGLNATFPTTMPSLKIDYIFLDPKIQRSSISAKKICDEGVSDHCMMVYQFEVPTQK